VTEWPWKQTHSTPGCNQISGICFVPFVILVDDFIEELLSQAKELAKWKTLFAGVIRASED
jgi:hypothetical protein